MQRIIIIVLSILVLVGLAIWKFAPSFNPSSSTSLNPNTPAELTVWGLTEDEETFRAVATAYTKLHPNIKINYVKQNLQNYRTRVQTQILNKQGPDVFMLHNTWVSMLQKTLALQPAPSSIMTIGDFSKTYYPVAKDSFVSGSNIYAIPANVDGLALFYNEDILKAANVAVPQTWSDFIVAAAKMTVSDSQGNIQTSGAALGTTSNVDNWPDILGLLFLEQPGADLNHPTSSSAADILRFYTNFVRDPRQKFWDPNLESSTKAFYSGRLAFLLGPFSRYYDIHQANASLHFKTAPVPQLPGGKIGWGSFWGYGVSSASKYPNQSWEFVKFLGSKEVEQLIYQQDAQTKTYGYPYARVDLQSQLSADPIIGTFVTQAPTYKTWFLASGTGDQGVNDEMIGYYKAAVEAVLQGSTPENALAATADQVRQSLDKFTTSTQPQK